MNLWRKKSAGGEALQPKDYSLNKLNYESNAAQQERLEAEQKIVFERFPVGSGFNYLGAEMRVTEHHPYWKGIEDGNYSLPGRPPKIVCNYRTTDGHFHDLRFDGQHFTAISKGFQP